MGELEMTALQSTSYEPLVISEAIRLCINLNLFKQGETLSCEEIGDGNLNLVFRVVNDVSGVSYIVKQALPYAKVVGESWPLTLDRARIEKDALEIYEKIVPGSSPKIFFSNSDLSLTVMEDLSHLTIARQGLIDGKEYPLLSTHVGEFLAKTLFYTSDFGLVPEEKRSLSKQFYNPELCKITEDLVFTDPFFNHDTNDFEEEIADVVHALWEKQSLKFEVAQLKRAFLIKGDALCHGDLHTGSLFVGPTETKIIDPEFAFYGPFGFDVGEFIANLLLNAVSKNKEEAKSLIDHVQTTWDVFYQVFHKLWKENSVEIYTKVEGFFEQIIQEIWEDALGFAGCEIIRRTIGLAHVKDLDGIESFENRINAKKRALHLGEQLIVLRKKIRTVKEIQSILHESTLNLKEV
jgi:5-methylthioribose kinase